MRCLKFLKQKENQKKLAISKSFLRIIIFCIFAGTSGVFANSSSSEILDTKALETEKSLQINDEFAVEAKIVRGIIDSLSERSEMAVLECAKAYLLICREYKRLVDVYIKAVDDYQNSADGYSRLFAVIMRRVSDDLSKSSFGSQDNEINSLLAKVEEAKINRETLFNNAVDAANNVKDAEEKIKLVKSKYEDAQKRLICRLP
jgi:hypothetical protein